MAVHQAPKAVSTFRFGLNRLMNTSHSDSPTSAYQAEPVQPTPGPRVPVWAVSLVFVSALVAFLLFTGRREVSRWHFAAARNALDDGLYEEAIESANKGLKWNPEYMDLVRLRAMSNLELENFEACLEDYDLLLEAAAKDEVTNENDMAPQVAKASVLQRMDRYPEAIAVWDEVVEFRKEQYRLRDDSESQYAYAISLNNRAYTEAQAWVVEEDSVNIKESLGDIREGIRIRGEEIDDPVMIDTLGYLLLLNGDTEEALAELNRAVNVTREENENRRMQLTEAMQRVVDQRPYQEALEGIKQNLAVILHHRGEALIAVGESEAGNADIEEAKRLGYSREDGIW